MNKDVMTKWVAALRSGKYKQGQKALCTTTNKYCCLGVLCDISGLGKFGLNDTYPNLKVYLGQASAVPKPVQAWAGLQSSAGYFPKRVQRKTCLRRMNDDGFSFEEIANIIEKHWEEL